MEWFKKLNKTAKVPQYLQERILDLKHAAELAKTSPRESRQVISHVVLQLKQHHNEEFIPALYEVDKIMLDSPSRAITALKKIAEAMLLAKEIDDEDKKNPWRKK